MPEMISKKLQLMRSLSVHLEGVGAAWEPDCPFELAGSVYRGRVVFGDDVPVPFISILEAPRQISPDGGGEESLMQNEGWTLLIQGFADDDPTHPTDPAYQLLAWVQKRLSMITQDNPTGGRGGKYPAIWRLGGKVSGVRYQIPIVRPGKDDVSDTAYFYMPISVGVVTDLTQPFVQEE